MSESTYRPKQVADQLGISPATLRLWSNNFSEVLSPSAQSATTEKGTAAQRRYTDEDVRYFHRAKQLLDAGKKYEEVLETLKAEGLPDPEVIAETIEQAEATETSQTSSALATTSQMQIALISLREALETKDALVAAKDEIIASQQQTISATERHVTDLQEENRRLRQELETRPEVTEPPEKPLSWWKRVLGLPE